MTTEGSVGGWRLAEASDAPFLYHLAVTIEPRWWRLTRVGTSPPVVMQSIQQCDAGGVVLDDEGRPVGAAVLAEGSVAARTAVLDLHALPDERSQSIVRRHAPDIVRAAIVGAQLRRLYHHRFDDDPDLLGDTGYLWETEVVFPEFAIVDGSMRARSQLALDPQIFAASFPTSSEPR